MIRPSRVVSIAVVVAAWTCVGCSTKKECASLRATFDGVPQPIKVSLAELHDRAFDLKLLQDYTALSAKLEALQLSNHELAAARDQYVVSLHALTSKLHSMTDKPVSGDQLDDLITGWLTLVDPTSKATDRIDAVCK